MAHLVSVKCFTMKKFGTMIPLRMTSLGISRRTLSSKKMSSDEYLHQSIIPTMHYQKSLPRLPIPKLEDTVRKYLTAQRPLLDDHQFRTTERIAHDFLNGEGKQLHEELVALDKNNKHTSYTSALFLDMHLSARWSLLFFNTHLNFNPDPRPEYNDQLVRATNMVYSAMCFMKALRAERLEPEVIHLNPAKTNTDHFKKFMRWVPSSVSCYVASMVNAYPLDMSQYSHHFNSTRIPKCGQDELFTDDTGRHVLVMKKGNMYVFDIADRDGNLVKPAEIQSHLKYILSDPTPVPAFPLGLLTSENRNVWADLRDKLVAAGNAETLRVVDSALFCLCLDDDTMRDHIYTSRNMQFVEGCNRWLDKSFSIILSQDGQAALSFEHSWGDGQCVISFMNEIFKDTTERPVVHPGSAAAAVDSSSAVNRLQFNLNSELENGIMKAKDNFDFTVSRFTINTADFKKGGKKQLKKNGLSPDAIAQLALQMAFLREYGQTVTTVESCSTTRFKHGRLELILPVTIHTKRCSHAFVCQPGQHSVEQLKALLSECSTYHRQLITEASMGQGFICHLYALQHLASSKSQDLPSLFTDLAYTAINQNKMTTSSLTAPAMKTYSSFPLSSDKFCISYSIHENCIIHTVISDLDLKGHEFLQSVQKSLEDIFTALEGKPVS